MFTLNVGCLYARATPRSVELMRRVEERLTRAQGWDQQVFNEELLFLAHGDRDSAFASVRVMDYLKFVNTKTFFKSHRDRFIPRGPRRTRTRGR